MSVMGIYGQSFTQSTQVWSSGTLAAGAVGAGITIGGTHSVPKEWGDWGGWAGSAQTGAGQTGTTPQQRQIRQQTVVVGLRVRPFSPRERSEGEHLAVETEEDCATLTLPTGEKFEVNVDLCMNSQSREDNTGRMGRASGAIRPEPYAVPPDASRNVPDLRHELLPGIKRALTAGRHVNLIAYGALGAGKAHSVTGDRPADGIGIFVLAASALLEQARSDKGRRLWCSITEACSSTLRDLLTGSQFTISESKGGVEWVGVELRPVDSWQELAELIAQAQGMRTTTKTTTDVTQIGTVAVTLTLKNTQGATQVFTHCPPTVRCFLSLRFRKAESHLSMR